MYRIARAAGQSRERRAQAAARATPADQSFSGTEEREVTVTIRSPELTVTEGLTGDADLAITADAQTWIDFLAAGPLRQAAALPAALVRRTMALRGNPLHLQKFSACFPK
jgi:hypothetical protein